MSDFCDIVRDLDPSSQRCHVYGAQVMFSSVAALLGSAGQSSYASANGALDGMAVAWARTGAPATSLQWGAWAGAGMAARDASTATRIQRAGMNMVNPAQGLSALGGVLATSAMLKAPVTAAIPFDWQSFMEHKHVIEPTMFDEFSHTPAVEVAEYATGTGSKLPIKGLSMAEMTAIVQSAVRSVLGTEITSSQALMAAGDHVPCRPSQFL